MATHILLLKISLIPLQVGKKSFGLLGSWYSNRPAQSHRFNAKIGFVKYAPSVPRYYQKSVKNRPSKPNQQNLTHFGRYLRTRYIFFKTDFCIEIVRLSRLI